MTFERLICLNVIKWKYEYFNVKKARLSSLLLFVVVLFINVLFMIYFLIDYSKNVDKNFMNLSSYNLWTRVYKFQIFINKINEIIGTKGLTKQRKKLETSYLYC